MKILVAIMAMLALGCGGEAYDEQFVQAPAPAPDAGAPKSTDYWWCKGAGWPEVPRCKAALQLHNAY